MVETYSFLWTKGGYDVFRGSPNKEKIGRLEGRRISLAIPCLDYCERHGVSLESLRDRKIRFRSPSNWTVFEMTNV